MLQTDFLELKNEVTFEFHKSKMCHEQAYYGCSTGWINHHSKNLRRLTKFKGNLKATTAMGK